MNDETERGREKIIHDFDQIPEQVLKLVEIMSSIDPTWEFVDWLVEKSEEEIESAMGMLFLAGWTITDIIDTLTFDQVQFVINCMLRHKSDIANFIMDTIKIGELKLLMQAFL